MSDSVKRDAFTLKRWSQRKLEAARAAQAPAAAAVAPQVPPTVVDASPAAAPPAAAPAAPDALPPVESLTIDSDFTAFLRPDVDETLRRGALRRLFSDPRFNVMDGLDVYIDDYSKPDPLPPELVRQLVHARYIFDPPATRVNAQGEVEDVPPTREGASDAVDDSVEAQTLPPALPVSQAPSPGAAPSLSPQSDDDALRIARDAEPKSSDPQ